MRMAHKVSVTFASIALVVIGVAFLLPPGPAKPWPKSYDGNGPAVLTEALVVGIDSPSTFHSPHYRVKFAQGTVSALTLYNRPFKVGEHAYIGWVGVGEGVVYQTPYLFDHEVGNLLIRRGEAKLDTTPNMN